MVKTREESIENSHLLNKLISPTNSTSVSKPSKKKKKLVNSSLNFINRKNQLEQIAKDNRILLEKINTAKPYIDKEGFKQIK